MSDLIEIGFELLHYVVTDKIGEGGMGEVYKGWDKLLKRPVAIKVMRPIADEGVEATKRFLSEARVLAQINHPCVTTIYEIQDHADLSFIVMEYLEGKSLKEYLGEDQPPISKVFDLYSQAAIGFSHIHEKGILHRDIKPANLFVTGDGQLKIIDFGISKWEKDPDGAETSAHHFMGSLLYSAPEIFLLTKPNISTEVYSLGISLVNSLLGFPLYDGDSSTEIISKIKYEEPDYPKVFVKNIPEPVLEFLQLTIEKDPRDRIANMQDFSESLQNLKQCLSQEFLSLSCDDLLQPDLDLANKGLKKEWKKDNNIFTMTLDSKGLKVNKKNKAAKSKVKSKKKNISQTTPSKKSRSKSKKSTTGAYLKGAGIGAAVLLFVLIGIGKRKNRVENIVESPVEQVSPKVDKVPSYDQEPKEIVVDASDLVIEEEKPPESKVSFKKPVIKEPVIKEPILEKVVQVEVENKEPEVKESQDPIKFSHPDLELLVATIENEGSASLIKIVKKSQKLYSEGRALNISIPHLEEKGFSNMLKKWKEGGDRKKIKRGLKYTNFLMASKISKAKEASSPNSQRVPAEEAP